MQLATNGKRIRDLRYELGLTQADLAARAGVHFTHVYRIEEGQRGATAPVLKRLADALGVTVSEITIDAAKAAAR